MKKLTAFKFRLKTNSTLRAKLASIAGCNRLVWNKALATQKERLEKREYTLSYYKIAPLLLDWKKEQDFLKDCPSQSLQQTLMALDRAIKDAFNKKSPKRFPQFKKKGQNDSFRYPQGIKVKDNQVFLPKLGRVKFFKSRELEGQIKNAIVSKKGDYWFVSIQTEAIVKDPVHPSKSTIGVDLGIKKFAALSNGRIYAPKNSFKQKRDKLAAFQRRLAKMKKGSKNFLKLKKRINRLHTTIANIRNDYLHKVSTDISKNHALVVLEDLKVANMSRSAKGTIEEPGNMVAAKSGLNRSILDQGWHALKSMLTYKQENLGGELLLVDPKYTSQKCSQCEHKEEKNRTEQAGFKCLRCGHEENADINAAKNILAAGHAVLSLNTEAALLAA